MVVLIVEVVMMIGTPLQVVVLIVVVDVVMIGTPKLVGVLIVVIVMMGRRRSSVQRPPGDLPRAGSPCPCRALHLPRKRRSGSPLPS